jgi:hypothetical protein
MSLLLLPPYAMLAGSDVAAMGSSAMTPPSLSLPLALPLGDTSGYLGVTTDEGDGTLYYVVTTSATPPSAAQVKAGQNNGGTAAVYAGSQAIGSTGAKTATATGLSSATAYYGYFMHEDAAANQSSVSASATFSTLTTGTSDTDFDTLVAAMTGAPTDLRKGYIARLIGALYAASVWSKMDFLYITAAHDATAAGLNWKAPASFVLSLVNSPTFTADRGYNGDGSTSNLNTGWKPATNGVQYTQNAAHIGTYCFSNGAGVGSAAEFGATTSTQIAVMSRTSGGFPFVRVNSASSVSSAAISYPSCITGVRQSDASNQRIYVRGAFDATAAGASAALFAGDLTVGRVNAAYTARLVSAFWVGGSLTDQEVADQFAALRAYMVAVGVDT